jgi:hypothetical protein
MQIRGQRGRRYWRMQWDCLAPCMPPAGLSKSLAGCIAGIQWTRQTFSLAQLTSSLTILHHMLHSVNHTGGPCDTFILVLNLRGKLSILSRDHTVLRSLMTLQKPSHYCTSCAIPCHLRRYVESIVDELAVTNFGWLSCVEENESEPCMVLLWSPLEVSVCACALGGWSWLYWKPVELICNVELAPNEFMAFLPGSWANVEAAEMWIMSALRVTSRVHYLDIGTQYPSAPKHSANILHRRLSPARTHLEIHKSITRCALICAALSLPGGCTNFVDINSRVKPAEVLIISVGARYKITQEYGDGRTMWSSRE